MAPQLIHPKGAQGQQPTMEPSYAPQQMQPPVQYMPQQMPQQMMQPVRVSPCERAGASSACWAEGLASVSTLLAHAGMR